MTDEPMIETLVCRRWPVLMPEHRANRPGWSYWEQERLSYMHAVIRPGDVVWEIGTEQGDVSVLYALWGAQVVLVEPDCGFWPNVKRIFEANGVAGRVVGTYHGFVGPTSDEATVYWEGANWPPCADGPTTKDRYPYSLANNDPGQHATLDDLLKVFPKPDVVSVDIDGAEYQMLLGCNRLLAEAKPILFISVHPDHLWDQHKDTPDDVWMHLELHDYQAERVGRDHELHIIGKAKP